VSEMTRVSARPIRPPAPATIKRISDMVSSSLVVCFQHSHPFPAGTLRMLESEDH
jgi:hypothetical protein